MPEKPGDVSELVGLVTMNRRIVLDERLLEQVHPHPIQPSKSLSKQAHELQIDLLLCTGLDNHRYQLWLLASRKPELHQLMRGFLRIRARLDAEINGPPQVDKIRVGLILDLHRFCLLLFLFVALRLVFVVFVVLIVTALAQNLRLQLLVFILVGLPVGVIFEYVQAILGLDVVVEPDAVGDLVLLLYKIQLLLDHRVVLVLILAHLEQNLNHVLRTPIDVSLVENVPELVEDGVSNLGRHLLQKQANLAHKSHGNLDTVVGGFLKQKQENLGGNHLVHHLVVDQVGDEHGGRETDGLVVSLESFPEAQHQTLDEQLSDLGELGVADGCQAGVDGSEWQTGMLCLEKTLAE